MDLHSMLLGFIAATCLAIIFGTTTIFFWNRLNKSKILLAKAESDVEGHERQSHQLIQQLTKLEQELADNRLVLEKRNQQLVEQRARFEQGQLHHQQQIEQLKNGEERLTQTFQNLASKIFEEKGRKFKEQNKESLDSMLSPLKNQISEFKKKVEDIYEKDTDDRRSLRYEILNLKELNTRLGQEAQNLTQALKGENKAQGNWGEMVLEKILEASGLRKGHEYEVQVHVKNEEGKRFAPDVVIRLPEGKDIVVDSKVSLTAYEQFHNADDEQVRGQSLKLHVQSVRKHVQQLSEKNYEQLEGIRTLDFVLMFVPIESAFLTAVEADVNLFTDAFNKNIIIVSPSTLLATLRTVQSIWRYENQNKNAERIAATAGGIYDQVALVFESIEEIGKHLGKSQQAYNQTIKRIQSGRGNLVGRVDSLKKLGARTKKQIPEPFSLQIQDFEPEE